MTLIECFTQSHIDNIAACLRLQPEKIVFVGDLEQMRIAVPRYERIVNRRGLLPEIILQDSNTMDLDDLFRILYKSIAEEDACTVDLTGGNEMVTMAIGAVLASLDSDKRKNVRVERFDYEQNIVIDCIHDNRVLTDQAVQLSVAELVELHGGCLHPDAYQPPKDSKSSDLDGLWKVITDAPKDWNYAIMLLGEFEKRSESKTEICLPLDVLWNTISNVDKKEPIVRDLLYKLQRYGVIDDMSTRYEIKYTYRSELLRYCVSKAGNVLEVKTLLEGRGVLCDGAPFFHDCRMSVGIDWDGVVFDPEERIPETRNEMDVILMRGITPLFVSCKNGDIGDEELYKLHTVAERFGGPNARKMLIATHLDRKSLAANRAFIQRAEDMNITLVTDAAKLTGKRWQQIFIDALK